MAYVLGAAPPMINGAKIGSGIIEEDAELATQPPARHAKVTTHDLGHKLTQVTHGDSSLRLSTQPRTLRVDARGEPTCTRRRELAYFRDALRMRELFVCGQAFASLPPDVGAPAVTLLF